MTTQQVANRLVELCRMGKVEDAQKELFAADATSTEPASSPFPSVQGMEAIAQKAKGFMEMVEEFHGAVISDPMVNGNAFALAWDFDATMKGQGRNTMKEICAYTVKDGKITAEQFFF